MEIGMFKKFPFFPARVKTTTWLFASICALTLGASACDVNLPANSLTPTPTTLMGYVVPDAQQGGVSTGVPTADSGGSGLSSDPGVLGDVCSLISASEAEAVIGQALIATTPGSDADSVSGGTLYFCTYLGNGIALVISRVDFDSSQAARQQMQAQLAQMLADDATTTSAQVTGIGDQAFWTTAENAAGFNVVQGNTVFSIILGGQIGDPTAHKNALQDLVVAVAGRL
jgi:hypothetical protein